MVMRLRTWAWLNLLVHALGLAVAALGMRPGTGVFTVAERMSFLAAAPLGWTAGWGLWMLCALALGAYFVVLGGQLEPSLRRAVLGLVTVAIAVDLLCDAAQIAVLPPAARGEPSTFLLVERWAGIGGTLVANGLYTLSALLATLALSRPLDRLLGAAVGVAGFTMALGGVLGSARLVEVATGPTIILYCGWALAVARSVEAG